MACAPSLPSGVLSEDDMEDVLYDMHVAQAIYETSLRENNPKEQDIIAMRASVLKKHDLTQAEWDSSMVYYSRNAHKLHGIYASLMERLERNIIALGGKVDGIQGEDADTANVWNTDRSFILTRQAPYNRFAFHVNADSTFLPGDRITLQYDAQLIFQDGMRDITAVLTVFYEGDSIMTRSTHTTSNSHGIVSIGTDGKPLKVKQIKGYFLLGQNLGTISSNVNGTTLQLAALSNVKLLHLHEQPVAVKKEDETAPKDSLAKQDRENSTANQNMIR